MLSCAVCLRGWIWNAIWYGMGKIRYRAGREGGEGEGEGEV